MTIFVRVLCVLCGLLGFSLFGRGFALDREAFAFTSYNLDVRVEPEQQRLAVRGKVTLRNDSDGPQRNLSLQISSSLDWRSIQFGGKAVQFVSQPYTSDIDHTGALSEAIVTLPAAVPPKGTIELDIGYEGIIPLDTTRLTRIGVPEEVAKHSDWDQIGKSFTAVRGIGYVAWYPVATESASLSEGNSVEETVGRWKVRNHDTKMSFLFESTADAPVFFSGTADLFMVHAEASVARIAAFSMVRPASSVPTFVIANYQKLAPKDLLTIQYLSGQEEGAKGYAEVAAQIDSIVPVGRGSESMQILGLPDPDAASFVSEGMLLCPLKSPVTNEAVLSMVYARARNSVSSPRAWIQDGLAHYAQVLYIEQKSGRRAALDYLDAHRQILANSENTVAQNDSSDKTSAAARSLINRPDDLYLQTKAMYVWWMLRDMLGENYGALHSYRFTEDNAPSYMQRLLEKQSKRDLEWFFDDWVYRDRGLPDFRVESAYPRPTVGGGYVVTVSVENLGNAGAEVPVTLRIEGGEVTKRLEVHAKSKASIRIEAPSTPHEIVVNDGSVPESDMSNNTYRIDGASLHK
jgi:hypothetical protein